MSLVNEKQKCCRSSGESYSPLADWATMNSYTRCISTELEEQIQFGEAKIWGEVEKQR